MASKRMMDDFLAAYRQVFGDDGQVRNCGREAALRLIAASDRLEPGSTHGDRHGFMDVDAIRRLYGRTTGSS